MRVTNLMMTSNTLNNIGRNKRNMFTAANQYETGQKIQRPSEDPVVAVRSLKYRTQLTELTQYVDKNIPDAFSWMDVTESAMKNVNEILTKMNTYCDQGANGTLETYDRNSIIETLQQYKEHIADMNNSDYAGRYVFTGYKTDVPMLFSREEKQYTYTIDETFAFADIEATSYVKGGARYDAAKNADDYAKQAPTLEMAQKIKLTYQNTDTEKPKVFIGGTDVSGKIVSKSLSEPAGACYTAGADEIIYVKETGELILGENLYKEAQKTDSIQVSYEKTNFEKGDVRPEHYFKCTAKNNVTGTTVQYAPPEIQKIQYEVNFSQMLTVNTLGKDAIPTYISSKIDELIKNVNQVFDMDKELTEVNKLIETEKDATKLETLKQLKEQLSTEQALKKKVLQNAFASGLTMTQKAEEQVNIALSNHGSRYLRLQLTEDRLSNQKTDFKEMLTNNDYVDMETAIINYKNAGTAYNASLACAATIVKNTLLDFL
ncbi:MAG: flagellar hook-associated protein FlgL [Acetivibrio ethanolgignens]